MSAWDAFNHPHRIQHTQRTRSTISQVTGLPTAPVDVVTEIEGDFQDQPNLDEVRIPGALVETGDAILYTVQAMAQGDEVLVSHDASNTVTSQWRVKAIEGTYDWIHDEDGTPTSRGYVLKRVEED